MDNEMIKVPFTTIDTITSLDVHECPWCEAGWEAVGARVNTNYHNGACPIRELEQARTQHLREKLMEKKDGNPE